MKPLAGLAALPADAMVAPSQTSQPLGGNAGGLLCVLGAQPAVSLGGSCLLRGCGPVVSDRGSGPWRLWPVAPWPVTPVLESADP